ncbi:hypothetical protein F4820DRAFT_241462 [Hypoxylon rubiginosum]|uniref:Uncharacterized protein n=1 Tax=Hypoxylon rubiginosum TaxID=110542 RepID=A0ACB9Z548_9PEZI|nr:hypothetical protein F4820DRAFT_241462 [Hypoxylon rubiginosum]
MKFSKAPAALLLLCPVAQASHHNPSRVVAVAKRADDDGSSSSSSNKGDDDDGDNDYLVSVCLPSAAPDTTALPPCVDVIAIETACAPNGTSPLALEAHAQCLCGGSYFAEWLGCRRCLEVHDILSPGNYSYFSTVLSSASNELCTGTPTAPLASLWAQVQAQVPEPTAGDDGALLTDIASGDAAVSLYYTASGLQGPGSITGSATLATASTTGTTTTGGGVSSSFTGSAGAQSTTNAAASSTTTSSSSNVAAPTGAAGGGKGAAFLAAAVGGVVLAAL